MALNVKAKIDEVVTPDLKKRVAAWWQGVDVDDLEWEDPEPLEDDVSEAEALVEAPPAPEIEIDMSHFIKVSEMLWGEGYVTPGGKNFIDLWGQQLSLNKEKSTAFLGAGLGGQARELNLSTGSWVSCFERHPEMVEASADQSMMAGLAKKVASQYYDPEKIELEAGKFNAIVCKEEFTTIEDKKGAIEAICAGMKTGGLFMFTDYVATAEELDAARLKEIFGDMRGKPGLWNEKEYVDCLDATGLDIHVNEELSEQYGAFINAAWGDYKSIVEKIKTGDETDLEKACLLKMIGISAELWTHVAMALESGEIQLRRFLARKK
jgi:phosphoethanolamine N-methyltransferase